MDTTQNTSFLIKATFNASQFTHDSYRVYDGYILTVQERDLTQEFLMVKPELGTPFAARTSELTFMGRKYTEAEQVAEGIDWFIQNDQTGIWFGPADYSECAEMLDGPNNTIIRN